jgi:hypothetical protein
MMMMLMNDDVEDVDDVDDVVDVMAAAVFLSLLTIRKQLWIFDRQSNY